MKFFPKSKKLTFYVFVEFFFNIKRSFYFNIHKFEIYFLFKTGKIFNLSFFNFLEFLIQIFNIFQSFYSIYKTIIIAVYPTLNPLVQKDEKNSKEKINFLQNKNKFLQNKNEFLQNKNEFLQNKNDFLQNKK